MLERLNVFPESHHQVIFPVPFFNPFLFYFLVWLEASTNSFKVHLLFLVKMLKIPTFLIMSFPNTLLLIHLMVFHAFFIMDCLQSLENDFVLEVHFDLVDVLFYLKNDLSL